MNAIPQKAHNYERLQLPRLVVSPRAYSTQNIEYLDNRRVAKLAAKKQEEQMKRKQQEALLQRRKELAEMRKIDQLYNPQRKLAEQEQTTMPKKAKKKSQGNKTSNARKLTAAYEVRTTRPNMPRGYSNNAYSINAGGSIAIKHDARPAIPGFDMHASGAAAAAHERKVAVEYPVQKKKGVFSTILTIALVFVMLAGVLNMYAQQSEVIYKNEQTRKEIETLQKDLEKYEMEIASKEDLNSIQIRAQELGMSHPKDNQIIYLPAENEVISVTAGIVKDADGNEITEEDASTVQKGDVLGNATSGLTEFFANTAEAMSSWLGLTKGA